MRVRGDRCLILRFRRSGFVGDEGRSLFDVERIGDRVLCVLRVRSLFDLRFRRSLDWISYNLK
jgi:hypothetical protein